MSIGHCEMSKSPISQCSNLAIDLDMRQCVFSITCRKAANCRTCSHVTKRDMYDGKIHMDEKCDAGRIWGAKFDQTVMAWLKNDEQKQ